MCQRKITLEGIKQPRIYSRLLQREREITLNLTETKDRTYFKPWSELGSCLLNGVCVLSHFSCVWLFATPWTVACQGPVSMGFSREEYWSRLSCSASRVFSWHRWNPHFRGLLHCRLLNSAHWLIETRLPPTPFRLRERHYFSWWLYFKAMAPSPWERQPWDIRTGKSGKKFTSQREKEFTSPSFFFNALR